MVSIELKYSLRMLLKKPWYSALTVMIVAIGLALTVYSFSLLNNLVFKPLTLNSDKEIIAIEGVFDHNHLFRTRVDPYHLNLANEQLSLFEEFGYYSEGTTFIGGPNSKHNALLNAVKMNSGYVDLAAFSATGVQPILGRSFNQQDLAKGAEPTVILSYEVWQQYFNSDKSVIGESLALDALPGKIIGVMPEGFSFPAYAQIWQPLSDEYTKPTKASYTAFFCLWHTTKWGFSRTSTSWFKWFCKRPCQHHRRQF
jgi:putative ABC transport system permease protein